MFATATGVLGRTQNKPRASMASELLAILPDWQNQAGLYRGKASYNPDAGREYDLERKTKEAVDRAAERKPQDVEPHHNLVPPSPTFRCCFE